MAASAGLLVCTLRPSCESALGRRGPEAPRPVRFYRLVLGQIAWKGRHESIGIEATRVRGDAACRSFDPRSIFGGRGNFLGDFRVSVPADPRLAAGAGLHHGRVQPVASIERSLTRTLGRASGLLSSAHG